MQFYRRTILIGLLVIIASPVLLVLLWIAYAVVHGTALGLMGYPVDVPPWELAKQIVESGKDPSYCNRLQQSVPVMGPSIESRRANCVYEYAKLTNAPSACALLLPSEYGMDCIKNTLPPVESPDTGINCEDRDGKMFCYSSQDALLRHNQDVVIDFYQCEKIADANRRDWCYIGRVRSISAEADCSKVVLNQDHRDVCIYTLAMKTKDADLCQNIQNEIRRAACGMLLAKY